MYLLVRRELPQKRCGILDYAHRIVCATPLQVSDPILFTWL